MKSTSLIKNESYAICLVGGKITEEYKQIVENFNIRNLYCLDFMSKEDLKKLYAVSDIFVLPTRGDVWGLVVN